MLNYIKTKSCHLFLKMVTKETSMFDAGLLFMIFGVASVGFNETYSERFGFFLTMLLQIAFTFGCVSLAQWAYENEKRVHDDDGFEDFKYAADMPFQKYSKMWNDDELTDK